MSERPKEPTNEELIPVKATSEVGGTDITLDDGTILTLKASIVEAWRVADQHDSNGFPVYRIRATMVSTTKSANEQLKKP